MKQPTTMTAVAWLVISAVALRDVNVLAEDQNNTIPSPSPTPEAPSPSNTAVAASDTSSNRMTVVKCRCGGDEVLVDGKCQPYPPGTQVYMPQHLETFRKILVPLQKLRVVVRDVQCTGRDYRQLNFTQDEFRLRSRGDLVLERSAGELSGLRVDTYCISHYLDSGDALRWSAVTCVPPPDVPTCCPPKHTLDNGTCRPADTPALLTPPISADPYMSTSAPPWPVVRNHVNRVNCSGEPWVELPMDGATSYIASHTDGVMHLWFGGDVFKQTFTSDLCINAKTTTQGTVQYTSVFCHEDADARYQRLCHGHTCVRKCCDEGEVMTLPLYKCTPNAQYNFTPAMTVPYKLITGLAKCDLDEHVWEVAIEASTGHLLAKGGSYPPKRYCTDTFVDDRGGASAGGIVCHERDTSWEMFQATLPVLMAVSIAFLVLTVVCYVSTPVLLNNGEWTHLCYAVSMIVAFTSSLSLHYFHKRAIRTCIAQALIKQFGWLATYLWLSVLCFDVWRLFRNLKKFQRPSVPHPVWYHLVGFGIPIAITCTTLGLQYAPDDIPWLIKPHLGHYKCWFSGIEQLIYIYVYILVSLVANCCFIGHTFWTKHNMTKSFGTLEGERTTEDTSDRRTNCYAELKRKFVLTAFMSTCYVADFLSWLIPPRQIWAPSDVLNSLQGVFVFFLFIQDRRKRTHLAERFPAVSSFFNNIKAAARARGWCRSAPTSTTAPADLSTLSS